jgi:hypothetical protein
MSSSILDFFPVFHIPYETAAKQNARLEHDSMAVAIPTGKKYFLWITHDRATMLPICVLVDAALKKPEIMCTGIGDPCLPQILKLDARSVNPSLKLGTLVYGTLIFPSNKSPVFIMEDVFLYAGIPLDVGHGWGDRCAFLCELVHAINMTTPDLKLGLPVMWYVKKEQQSFQTSIPVELGFPGYHVRSIQYRSIAHVAPYLNFAMTRRKVDAITEDNANANATEDNDNKDATTTKTTAQLLASVAQPIPRMMYGNDQFKRLTVFWVKAEQQYDVYSLYARDGGEVQKVFVGYAKISSLSTSMFMNSLFRRIRENGNLDYIEESEDEADFENTDETKFVDLQKTIVMDCTFDTKLKKWEPLSVNHSPVAFVVPIERLTQYGDKVKNHSMERRGRPIEGQSGRGGRGEQSGRRQFNRPNVGRGQGRGRGGQFNRQGVEQGRGRGNQINRSLEGQGGSGRGEQSGRGRGRSFECQGGRGRGQFNQQGVVEQGGRGRQYNNHVNIGQQQQQDQRQWNRKRNYESVETSNKKYRGNHSQE